MLMSQGAPVFYDNWVARDINGTALENAPFEQVFHHTESNHRFQRHLPIQGGLIGLLPLYTSVQLTHSPIMLEWYRRPRPGAVLRPAPCQVQNGQASRGRVFR